MDGGPAAAGVASGGISRGTVRDAHEAIALAERAVNDLGDQNADALDVLGAAYAAAGEFPRAIAAARRALDLLKIDGNPGRRTLSSSVFRSTRRGEPTFSRLGDRFSL